MVRRPELEHAQENSCRWRASARRSCLWMGLVLAWLAVPSVLVAQDELEIHPDYSFNTFPHSEDAMGRFSAEELRLFIAGLHKGWSIDKYIRETKNERIDVLTLADELQDDRLIRGRDDYDMRPAFPVVSLEELPFLLPDIDRDAAQVLGIIQTQWAEVEEFAASLELGHDQPVAQGFYRIVVGNILLGGMVDVFYDDKTMMPGPPKREGRSGYYIWFFEGEAPGPSRVYRGSERVGRYQVYAVGPTVEENVRVEIEELRQQAPVYEYDDARRWRSFGAAFSRDHLLPYFKAQRRRLLDLHSEIYASRYSAFSEFVAMYYHSVVSRVVDGLVRSGRIESPETTFRYALRSGR